MDISASLSVADLPEDIFLLILPHLEIWDIATCQRVSKQWREAFSQHTYLREVLRCYPKAFEVRTLLGWQEYGETTDWGLLFSCVARRYFQLMHGKIGRVDRYKLVAIDQLDYWVPVAQWDYHESQPGGRLYHENSTHLRNSGEKPYLFRPSLWSYDDGLVAAAFLHDDRLTMEPYSSDQIISILDLELGKSCPVPFSITGKVIRALTLRSRTLIIEWAECDPYHALNDTEQVHRHFVTCFDVVPSETTDSAIIIRPRNEWKLHFLGLPLNSRDRFFSTHTPTHYAIYIWQPNRSIYAGDEDFPIECLLIWDISIRTSYRPSLDPSGSDRPDEHLRPHVVARYGPRDLEFLGIAQFANINFISMHLDSEAQTLTFWENFYHPLLDRGDAITNSVHTSFPFIGLGPTRVEHRERDLPPYRGHCTMETVALNEIHHWPRQYTVVMDVLDEQADVRWRLAESVTTTTTTTTITVDTSSQGSDNHGSSNLTVLVKALGKWKQMDDEVVRTVGSMGKIAGSERWLVGMNSSMELCVVRY